MAQGYWINVKGWKGPSWLSTMRLSAYVAYTMVGLTSVAMMVFGVVLLRVGATTSGDASLWLSEVRGALTGRYGAAGGTWFVVGFFATSITTLLGVWQGVSLIVTDFARETWKLDVAVSPERSVPFRLYAAWLTFPPR